MILESVRLRRLTRKPEHAMRRKPVDVVESGFVWVDARGRASAQHDRRRPYFLAGPRHVRMTGQIGFALGSAAATNLPL
ncbi:hypothetical protein D3C71_904320 [compost metagenome]